MSLPCLPPGAGGLSDGSGPALAVVQVEGHHGGDGGRRCWAGAGGELWTRMAVECEPVTVGRRVWRTGVKLKLFPGAASLVFLSTVCVCCVQSAVCTYHILDPNPIQIITTAPYSPCTCPPWSHPNTVGLLPLQHAQLVPALGPPALQSTGAPVSDGAGEPQSVPT